jgi:CheY-like chemotaxis protein
MNQPPMIFIIDDNALLRALISEKLLSRNSEYQIKEFEHADNVLSEIDQEEPDLIILDYNLEGPDLTHKNGLQFLKALRLKHNTPVIALSGQTELNVMTSIIRQGANDYISKDDADFLEVIPQSVETILTFRKTQGQLKKTVNNSNIKFLLGAIIFLLIVLIIIALM